MRLDGTMDGEDWGMMDAREDRPLPEDLERLARALDDRDRVLAKHSRTRGFWGLFGIGTST